MPTKGSYKGSFLGIGQGSSDIFERDPNGRTKVDGLIKWDSAKKVSGFARIHVDVDLSSGADSIQSYFGVACSFSGIKQTAKKKAVKKTDPAADSISQNDNQPS